MSKYILDQLDSGDKVIKFNELDEINYPISCETIEDIRMGGTALLIYSFLVKYAFEYWEKGGTVPAGQIYIIMDLHDFVKVTGCSVQDVREALICLNEDRWVRVVKIQKEWGECYAYHATI